MKSLIINSLSLIDAAAAEFMETTKGTKIFAFNGEMGSGKTTFIKALCHHLGVIDIINSPTFSIVNEYNTNESIIYHFDFYRINSLREVYDIGFEDYISSGNICFIEWYDIVKDFLPHDTVYTEITVNENNSRIIQYC
jgi:tRNA threonylcarbamoyladenosine biosynthesis protein TsaE